MFDKLQYQSCCIRRTDAILDLFMTVLAGEHLSDHVFRARFSG